MDVYLNGIEKHPRVYLFDENTGNYTSINLVGHEFTFDVDMSQSACDLGATLYLVQMPADGGKTIYNSVGASYGTGYCDYHCPAKPLMNGTANINGYGTCCVEVDLWEANSGFTHLGYHFDPLPGPQVCYSTTDCNRYYAGSCGWNTDSSFYGWEGPLDVRQNMTVITQFHSKYSQTSYVDREPDAADDTLISIQRLFIQNGTLISKDAGSLILLDDSTCTGVTGGHRSVGDVIRHGMTLVLSMFYSKDFLGNGGGKQCWHYTLSNASVVFSNIRWGEIGSTYHEDGSDFVLSP